MIAFIASIWNWTVDTVNFAAAVIHDARALRSEAEDKYGSLGF